MIELLKREYWSKSNNFLLPLTGIKDTDDFNIKAFAKWDNHSLQYNELVVRIIYGHKYSEFLDFLTFTLFSKEKAFVTEVYDYEGFSILVFDLSEWSSDINVFLKGKYSNFSKEAKRMIRAYHNIPEENSVHIMIYGCLYPNEKLKVLDNMTPIEYAIKHYVMEGKRSKIDYNTEEIWKKTGELCSKCDEKSETLILDNSHVVIPVVLD